MREIFNFLNFGKEKKEKKRKRKRNIEVSKIFNFGNLNIYKFPKFSILNKDMLNVVGQQSNTSTGLLQYLALLVQKLSKTVTGYFKTKKNRRPISSRGGGL